MLLINHWCLYRWFDDCGVILKGALLLTKLLGHFFCIFLIKRNYDLKAKAVGLSSVAGRLQRQTDKFGSDIYSRPRSFGTWLHMDAGTERTSGASSELQQEEGQRYDTEQHQHVDEEQHPPAAVQPVGQRSPAH